MTFSQDLIWYGAKFIVCILLAFSAVKLGIFLRKSKDARAEVLNENQE